MECNRDEALRAKGLAEQKFGKQDFVGAKKFVLKAQQLFPSLEGLTQMLPVIEVHSVAQVKVGGNETDWYGILQLEPTADDATLKKQYRKLALLLHPDKNKAMGAEAAFKMLSEAWGILSDKAKRAVHDMKRGVKGRVARVVTEPFQAPFTAGAPAPPRKPTAAPQKNQQSQSAGAFWTACPNCLMQYQYHRTYENYQLQCPKCKTVFIAHEIPNPPSANGVPGYSWRPFDHPRQGLNRPPPTAMGRGGFDGATGSNGFANGSFPGGFPNQQGNAFVSSAAAAAAARSKVAAAAAAAAAATAATSAAMRASNSSATVASQAFHTAKRERVEAQEREKELKRKEKELKRKEREDLRKEKEEQKREKEERKEKRMEEAMERLLAKKKEHAVRNEVKQKVDVKRKLKRKKRQISDEDEDAMAELLEEDDADVGRGLHDDLASSALPRRRSGRARKNVTSYKVDQSDDSELEDFAPSRRARLEVESEVGEKEAAMPQQTAATPHDANWGKGKSVADEGGFPVHRGGGVNGREQFGGERRSHVSADGRTHDGDRREGKTATNAQASYPSDFGEPSSAVHVSRKEPHSEKSRPETYLPRQVETPKKAGEARCDVGDHSDFEDTTGNERPAPSVHTTRARSPTVNVTPDAADKKGEDNTGDGEEVRELRRPRIFPPRSPESTFSSQDEQESEDQISVPDPDIHDFDSRRTEKDLVAGQIWAMYDDQDGMPRFYIRINRVFSNPFRVQTCWLEKSSASIVSNHQWVDGSDISPPCGEFKIGKTKVFTQINCFSHIMLPKTPKGSVKIFPKREQVWAVFKDWSADERLGPLRVPRAQGVGTTFTYEMVLVLSDFSEERGVTVATLVKLQTFKTLFRREEGTEDIRTLKPVDVQKFSHNVPVAKVDEDFGFPLGTLELDPASTPVDLIDGTG